MSLYTKEQRKTGSKTQENENGKTIKLASLSQQMAERIVIGEAIISA